MVSHPKESLLSGLLAGDVQTHSSLVPQSGLVRNCLHLPSAIFNPPSTSQPTSPGLPSPSQVPGLLGPETSAAMAHSISLRGCHSRKAEPLDPGLSTWPLSLPACGGLLLRMLTWPPLTSLRTHFVNICQSESQYVSFVMMEVRGLPGQPRFLLPVKPDSGRVAPPFSFVSFFKNFFRLR